jgi:hypothetical protein
MREVAALVCVVFVEFLFWREHNREGRERISWAPFFWMVIAGSRFVSGWLNLRGPGTVDAYAEGSPVDRIVFFSLIVWGLIVLSRRQIDWRRSLSQNGWLAAYLLYCLASIAWTDEPLILVKRWAKDLGNPIMALVLLTERRPYDALVTTLRRIAFVLFPISVLFIRYYPEFGRAYAADGTAMYSGIADQKNTLGLSCLIVGIAYVSALTTARRLLDRYDLVLGAMLCWLLYMSNSQTSLTCLVVAMSIFAISRVRVVSRRPPRLIAIVLCSAGAYWGADALFQVQDHVLQLLGRNPTLTNRTDVWAVLRSFETDALVGAGFMSFWTGERMAAIWQTIGVPLNQAHNGYLEQYLNLGYVGVGFIAVIATTALLRVKAQLSSDYSFAVLRLCLIVAALLYNYTEASFYGISNIWVLFLAASIGPVSAERTEPQAVPEQARILARRTRRIQPRGDLVPTARLGRLRTAATIDHRDKRAEGRAK